MNNNFLSKTLKTFLTSLLVSVFVFGSFYFLLADNSAETPQPEVKKEETSVKNESSKKLVVNDEEEDLKDKEEVMKKVSASQEREVLGATTSNLLAQGQGIVPGAGETGIVNQTTVVTPQVPTTPTSQILVNTPTTDGFAASPAPTFVATGVPQTGNESLYLILGFFSLAIGFLIANGHSLAINKFEQEI